MAETAYLAGTAIRDKRGSGAPRHSLLVRITHWLNAISFIALAVSGIGIILAHIRGFIGRDRWTRGTIAARFTAALSSGRTIDDSFLRGESTGVVFARTCIYGLSGGVYAAERAMSRASGTASRQGG